MLFQIEDVRFLTQLGFTENQARIYLTLLKTGTSGAATIQKITRIARPAVYVTLDELQKKGLVEKEIAMPTCFRATPIDFALQSIIQQRKAEVASTIDKTKKFLREFQSEKENMVQAQDYRFIILSGKEKILNKMKKQHDNARFSENILSPLPRWLHIIHDCFEHYSNALDRGVEYRVIAETHSCKIKLSHEANMLLKKPTFQLKLTSDSRQTNSAIFDNTEATINFFPSKALNDSPIIWTNHPSILTMCQDHFRIEWESAKNFNW